MSASSFASDVASSGTYRLFGLAARPDLNGTLVKIVPHPSATEMAKLGRLAVKADGSDEVISVRRINLVPVGRTTADATSAAATSGAPPTAGLGAGVAVTASSWLLPPVHPDRWLLGTSAVSPWVTQRVQVDRWLVGPLSIDPWLTTKEA
jgi:hypothetical protein